MTKRAATVFALMIIGASLAHHAAAATKLLPRFEDFPVRTHLPKRGRPAEIGRPESETGAQFDQRVREAAKMGPDFAGHYAIVQWSCGAICVSLTVVDVQTGRIYRPRFVGVGECGPLVPDEPDLHSYRLASRLLIVRGSLEIPDPKNRTLSDGPCGTFYYISDRKGLKLIDSDLIKK